jgi:hypothetical protein
MMSLLQSKSSKFSDSFEEKSWLTLALATAHLTARAAL